MTRTQTIGGNNPPHIAVVPEQVPGQDADFLDHIDAPLIARAVRGAASLFGAAGAFKVDVTDDSDFAQAIDSQMLEKGRGAIKFAASYRPMSLDGLRCKSELLGVAWDHVDADELIDLVQSLIADIARFHKASHGAGAKTAANFMAFPPSSADRESGE